MPMNYFNQMSETKARLIRWVLTIGWIALILSLYFPVFGTAGYPAECYELDICGPSQGNYVFWNIILPYILICVILSHELWRRVCPLSFISQIPRTLGIQRKVATKNGKTAIASVDPNSWLGKHHFELQWTLLISGISLRILLINSNTLGLAILFTIAMISSIIVGWAFSGKAWCQYVCPFGAVQKVIVGPRALIGSNAHIDNPSKITQSMCRTVSLKDGKSDKSTCVACNKSCIDIDSQRSYWESLHGNRGIEWAWYSYPGLVIGFFLLTFTNAPASIKGDYIQGHLYAYDQRLPQLILQPLLPDGFPTIPRLIGIPLLLVGFAFISKFVFSTVQRLMEGYLNQKGANNSKDLAIHRTRLIATFTAVNSYFLFKGSMWSFSTRWTTFVDMVVMAIISMWIVLHWNKSFALYQRESTVTSLRKQLLKIAPEKIKEMLLGRSIKELDPNEIFVLAKALPQHERGMKREIYLNVLQEQLEHGRLDSKTSLVRLEELRLSLGLSDDDHYSAIDMVTNIDPKINELSPKELIGRELRITAAREELKEIMSMSKIDTIDFSNIDNFLKNKIEHIQIETGLDCETWNNILSDFTQGSTNSQVQVSNLVQYVHTLNQQIHTLNRHSDDQPILLPVITSIEKNIAKIMPSLVDKHIKVLDASDQKQPDEFDCSVYAQILSSERISFLQPSEGILNPIVDEWAKKAELPPSDDDRTDALTIDMSLEQIMSDNWEPQQREWINSIKNSHKENHTIIEDLGKYEKGRKFLSFIDIKASILLPNVARIHTYLPGDQLVSHEPTVSILLDGSFKDTTRTSSIESAVINQDESVLKADEGGFTALVFHEIEFMKFMDRLPLMEVALTRKYLKPNNFMSVIDLSQ